MEVIDLNGKWKLREAGTSNRIQATVPGCVHTDLIAAGKIPDPFYRDNEDNVRWIGETDWVYSRSFDVSVELLNYDRVLLRCAGLDTLAAITINGKRVGRTDNMFRTWEFDVKNLLKVGRNFIEVCFNSVLSYIRKKERTYHRRLPAWKGKKDIKGGNWVRKEQCNFGWDWGPALLTCGIWRQIDLVAFDTARLADVQVLQRHVKKKVQLEVSLEAEKLGHGKLSAGVTVSYRGRIVAETEMPLRGKKTTAVLEIGNPKLWWPNGMGDQPLYEVSMDLLDTEGELLDTATKRIGLRTLKLERKKDKWGESFRFAVNGVSFFAKGGNWIPADTFVTRLTRGNYKRLLNDAAAVNMNMLRVWGGGIYENDIFYDLCDELGICVWQDFMFACATYPTFDGSFMAGVKAEAEDNVRRLRHHSCIALWCGNNELEQGLVGREWTESQMSWQDYGKLFDKLLPDVVHKHDPKRDYWSSSPHTPGGNRADFNNPDTGDAHLWGVWHRLEPFEWYRTCEHRFTSEFGFQSFPEPKTVRGYTVPGDRNITSPVMEHHQRSAIGNTAIIQYMLDWYRMPASFETTLWLSQILQSMAIKYAVEHWRRSMPRGMGALYWQINDCWPVASWSSIDFHGRWKALHYAAKKFYAPVLVSGVEDPGKSTVHVHVTNDPLKAFSGRVRWTLATVSGKVLAEDTFAVKVGERSSKKVKTLDLSEVVACAGARDLLIWLEVETRGRTVSSNLVTFVRPKQLELQDPRLSVSVRKAKDHRFTVTLKAKKPALWVWLELSGIDASISDNFFHVMPGKRIEVEVVPAQAVRLEQFKKKLKVRSLVDTY